MPRDGRVGDFFRAFERAISSSRDLKFSRLRVTVDFSHDESTRLRLSCDVKSGVISKAKVQEFRVKGQGGT